MFSNLKDQIVHEQRNVTNLHSLLKEIQRNPQSFDEDDQNAVKKQIDRVTASIAKMNADLNSRQHTYETTVVKMEQAIQVRQRVLEEIDSQTQVLDTNPELCDMLVEKQSALQATLAQMKEKLGLHPSSSPTN